MNLPLAHLSPIQSLGWLAAGQSIRCVKSIAGFTTDKWYPVRQFPVIVQRTIKRPAMSGPDRDYRLTGRDLCFAATDDWGKERLFVARRHIGEGIVITAPGSAELARSGEPAFADLPASLRTALARLDQAGSRLHHHLALEALVEHFDIIPPPDIAQANPALYEWNLQFLKYFEQMLASNFHWKPFQLDDLSRMAIPDGVVYGGDCGVGKTPMAIAWALLKVGLHSQSSTSASSAPSCSNPGPLTPAAPVLIVAPGGLHDQMLADYQSLFGAAAPIVTRIHNQDEFSAMLAANSGRLRPGFYISSYTEIALNKFQILPQIPDGPMSDPAIRAYTNFFGVNAPTPAEGLAMCRHLALTQPEKFSKPSLAALMDGHFTAVAIDEGVRIKGDDTIIGLGVRSLNPRYRLVLTGTPVKNRLPDIQFLAAWACNALDAPNDRWPYGPQCQASGLKPQPSAFSDDFQVHSITAKPARPPTLRSLLNPKVSSPKSHPSGVPIAEITNIHKLRTILAPVVLRRRKCDIPEQEIVPKIYHTVTVPMGVEQARVYQHHLQTAAYDRRGLPAVGAKLMALRAAAAAPGSESLGRVRSAKSFTPKVRACLEIVRGVLERGEQVIIFSPFHEPLDVLHGYLAEANIPHDVLDGRISQKLRAQLAANFKRGLQVSGLKSQVSSLTPSANPVLLAGLKACAEGFSFEKCNNVILFAPDWALDLMRQAVDRAHRINSKLPVNVWSLPVSGSIEARMYSMLDEKGEAADIALDGSPAAFATEEMHLADLLKIAQSEFTREGLIDEETCLGAWPRLGQELVNAWEGRA
jgi:hypothetical protein